MVHLRQADVKLVDTERFSSCTFSDQNFIYKHSSHGPKLLYLRELVRNNPNPLKGKECSTFTDTGMFTPLLFCGDPHDSMTVVSLNVETCKFETGPEKNN